MGVTRKLIKGGAWLTLANVVSKISSAFTLPVLARLLGPEGLGIYSVVFSLAQSAQGFSSLGAEVVMHRDGAQYETIGKDTVGRLFGVGMTLVCIVSLALGVGTWVFKRQLAAYWLGQPEVEQWIGAAAVLIVLQPFGNIPLLFLASLQDFRAYALRSSLGIVSGSACTVALTWGLGLRGAVLGLILSIALQIIWSYLIVRSVLKAKEVRLRIDRFWEVSRHILKSGFPYYFGNTLIGNLAIIPVLGVVSLYGGLEQLGFLRVAQSLAAIIGFIPSAIAPAAISYLSASSVDDVASYNNLKSVHLRSVWILLLVLTSPACLLLPFIINILYGSAYQQTYTLSWLSLWLSLLVGVNAVLVQYLLVAGKTVKIAWISTLGVASFVVSALILVPRYKALGFLLAQIIGQFVGLPFVVYPAVIGMDSKSLKKLRYLTFITVLALIWTFCIPFLKLNSFATLALACVSTAIIGVSIYMKILHPSERLILKDYGYSILQMK